MLELHARMAEAWELARQNITRAQKRQKTSYDRRCRPPQFREGERVFLFKPAEKTGETGKFARPFHGPFRIIELESNTVKIRRVDRPGEEPILVALDRLRRCPEELADNYWPPDKTRERGTKKAATGSPTASPGARAVNSPDASPGARAVNSPDMDHDPELAEADGVQKDSASAPAEAMGLLPDTDGDCPEHTGELTAPKKWDGRLRTHRRRPRFLSEDGHV